VTYLPAPLSSRNQFGQFLNDRGLIGEAVEVGTHRGEFARQFLGAWSGKLLHLVDPYWRAAPSYLTQVGRLPDRGPNRRADFDTARHALREFDGRYRFVVRPSPAAAGGFADGSLDFVYVDGDHAREAVFDDLIHWWPKLKAGGVLAGHDWACPGEDDGLWAPGVQYAVARFCELHGVEFVYLVVEENGLPWSFYTIKGGGP
jgi:hypothetical protein